MQLKWFRGERLADVMREVREALGPDAVIMHTKTERASGVRRVFGRPIVAVLAGIDEDGEAGAPARAPVTPRPAPVTAGAGGPTAVSRGPASASLVPVADVRPSRPSGLGADARYHPDALWREVTELRRLLLRAEGGRALGSELAPFWERLTAAGVDEALAFRVLERVPPPPARPGSIDRAVEDAIVAALGVPVTPAPGEAARIFVGPPGSGKTAMVSKLAVRARLDGARAHIVSLDGATLGVRAHLEALTAHAGVPHALALTAGTLRAAIAAIPAGALRLVDTPGVSPGDTAGVAALAELVGAAGPVDVHLVLPATAKTADALAAVGAFAPLGARRLVFTRLDETTSAGSLVSVAAAAGLALAYFGTGRDIPHDMEPATPRALARRVLGGERFA